VRTTLNLDDDVSRPAEQGGRQIGSTFETRRQSPSAVRLTATETTDPKAIVVKPIKLGLPHFEKVEELIESLEGPDHR